MKIRVTGDINTGKLLGAQIVGHWRSEVAKRIDVFAVALFHKISVGFELYASLEQSVGPRAVGFAGMVSGRLPPARLN